MKHSPNTLTEVCLCSSIYATADDHSRFFLEKDMARYLAKYPHEISDLESGKSMSPSQRMISLLIQEVIKKQGRKRSKKT